MVCSDHVSCITPHRDIISALETSRSASYGVFIRVSESMMRKSSNALCPGTSHEFIAPYNVSCNTAKRMVTDDLHAQTTYVRSDFIITVPTTYDQCDDTFGPHHALISNAMSWQSYSTARITWSGFRRYPILAHSMLRLALHIRAHNLKVVVHQMFLLSAKVSFSILEPLNDVLSTRDTLRWILFHYAFPPPNAHKACVIVALKVKRNLMLRHDYIALLYNSNRCPSNLRKLVLGSAKTPKLQHPQPKIRLFIVSCELGFAIGSLPDFTWYVNARRIGECVRSATIEQMNMASLKCNRIMLWALCCSHTFNASSLSPAKKPLGCSRRVQHFPRHRWRTDRRFHRPSQQPKSLHTSPRSKPVGGKKLSAITLSDLEPYVVSASDHKSNFTYRYVDHVDDIALRGYPESSFLHAKVPLPDLLQLVSITSARKIARCHGLVFGSRDPQDMLVSFATHHSCTKCTLYFSVFSVDKSVKRDPRFRAYRANATDSQNSVHRAKERERVAEFRASNPEYRERERERVTEFKASHHEYREREGERVADFRASNPEYRERERERVAEFKASNHEYRERERERVAEFRTSNTLYREKEREQVATKRASLRKAMEHDVTDDLRINEDLFPPEPLDDDLSHAIATGACKRMGNNKIEEAGCGICGTLAPVETLSRLKSIKNLLYILCTPGVTRIERKNDTDKIKEYKGPVLDYGCNSVCQPCRAAIHKNKVPRNALAKGFWIGKVPEVLSSLRFVERMLIARVRHTCCFVRVSSGGSKMKANAVAFESPVPKIYAHLPPPKADLDDVLAVLYTGPSRPTEEDFKRTPLLVRRNHVIKALEWLKLNHSDYADIDISETNLKEYPEDMPPVSIEYKPSFSNKTPEGTSVFDMEENDGTEEGDCPFVVHGLTGENLETMSTNAIKARALQHLNNHGKVLAVGQSDRLESIWNNPQLYPQMFPWLFPYGLGGIGSFDTSVSDRMHKKYLMMYHDKRFQTDPTFPFVAFSHDQMKASSTQSWLMAEKRSFGNITKRLLELDQTVLTDITTRMVKGEHVKPETDEEKNCFQVLRDLDPVAGKVSGSTTTKKYMRNEIWSLIAHRGAPSWYITLSPADLKHPVCIYWAESKEKFEPNFMTYSERVSLICRNPAAAARFFHFIVETFIAEVLGVDADHRGLYGDTSAYYGTVEQQGRLTLHLHLLLWLRGCATPQEMRDRMLDPESGWQKKIVAWLESSQIGEFMTGSQKEVEAKVNLWSKSPDYKDPTGTMPEPPPPKCEKADQCKVCQNLDSWWSRFKNTVDDLLSKSNIHNCKRFLNKDGTHNKKHEYVGCLENKWGKCKARFPRPIYDRTEIDTETGALNLKKGEPWLNSVTPLVTYLFRCNTDVTSLCSGTAIKAVVLYVSDYITKSSLKTHVVFDSIKAIFTKNREMIGGNLPDKEKGRQLMTKIVNLLSTKMEMGAPMICMYLLGNPDHYTDHSFVPFYWRSYVTEARKVWHADDESANADKFVLIKQKGKIIGLSPVLDYIYRSPDLESMTLYDWVRRSKRVKIPTAKKKNRGRKGRKEYMSGDTSLDDSQFFGDESLMSSMSKESHNLVGDDSCDTVNVDNTRGKVPKHAKNLSRNMFAFTEDHPLFQTHATRVAADGERIVPNFIGGNLPRRDHGDREFYCSTMLTLFKPWRSGFDLKLEGAMWDETFVKHSFTSEQAQLINNFNIRYECLDARDDFRAQLKSGAAGLPNWDAQVLDQLGESIDADVQYSPDDVNIEEYLPTELNKSGKSTLKRQHDMAIMRNVITNAGWTVERPGTVEGVDLHPVAPLQYRTGSEWKSEVQRKRQELIERRSYNIPKDIEGNTITGSRYVSNDVKVVDKSYLERGFQAQEHQLIIDTTSTEFKLNAEQERAFRIVANHAVSQFPDQLKLYIGGMGGTRKSQVLEALTHFFSIRNESHRLAIVAPTGSAAALLGGSTYHYLFGINDKRECSNLSQIHSRILGVEYVFLDEVSMLSARDMYKISARLANVRNRLGDPFGGINMIFAGDFAQLPPAIGGEHVSLFSRFVGAIATSMKSQEEAIGKALWHQVTSVVILRENMRQRSQTALDVRLRSALENMRYKACTVEDIDFLRSRVSSSIPGRASVCDNVFRNVSIITAFNVHKDEINRLGSIRFANETSQSLTEFYSEDTVKTRGNNAENTPSSNARTRKINSISENMQKELWNQPYSTAGMHIAGKLALCIGMPVMIRCNSATELCMTKGQEGFVHAWQTAKGSRGQQILDTLFVKLDNPPSPVKFDDLPENVIPLSRTSNNIYCSLRDDTQVNINRSQVEVLPNFSMTDYASQGKTRQYNVVDLHNSRTHYAYYTALSRSASAAGTCILQGFDARKITGGSSGSLRQEFRELELLDDITKLRFEGKLPEIVVGERRNVLIKKFREWKGKHYVPMSTHQAIRWNSKDPLYEPDDEVVTWHIVSRPGAGSSNTRRGESVPKGKKFKFVPAQGSTPVKSVMTNKPAAKIDESFKEKLFLKRKINVDISSSNTRAIKKVKYTTTSTSAAEQTEGLRSLQSIPVGTRWSENSCAYDSIITILHGIWQSDRTKWSTVFNNINSNLLGYLGNDFAEHAQGLISLEVARDRLRHRLQNIRISDFRWGQFTSISSVLEVLLQTRNEVIKAKYTCPQGHIDNIRQPNSIFSCLVSVGNNYPDLVTIEEWMTNMREVSHRRCRLCTQQLTMVSKFHRIPELLAVEFSGKHPIINSSIRLNGNGTRYEFVLKGIIYFGGSHFTSRIVGNDDHTWFHDGAVTGIHSQYQGMLNNLGDLMNCQGKVATAVLYARV